MRWAQVKAGQKLHLVYEPGEGHQGQLVRAGNLGEPLCGIYAPGNHYRLTINVPMRCACKNCVRVARARGQW